MDPLIIFCVGASVFLSALLYAAHRTVANDREHFQWLDVQLERNRLELVALFNKPDTPAAPTPIEQRMAEPIRAFQSLAAAVQQSAPNVRPNALPAPLSVSRPSIPHIHRATESAEITNYSDVAVSMRRFLCETCGRQFVRPAESIKQHENERKTEAT